MTRSTRALLLLAVACAPAPKPTPPRVEEAGSKSGSSVASTVLPEAARDLSPTERAISRALSLVSGIRGLPIRSNVPGIRLDREALQAEVAEMLTDEVPEALIAGNTDLLFALDLVPAGFDFKAVLTHLYGAQLAGYYDPDENQMVLATDLDEDAQELTLYHELVHALQDQHYQLGEALDWKPERSDALAALQCLAEGDATSAMLDVFAHSQGNTAHQPPAELLRLDSLLMQVSPEQANTPGVILRSLVAPYADGLKFVNALRRQFGGFTGVDRAWRDPPVSTEQILHPEKYLAREAVLPLPSIEPPPGFSEEGAFRDVIGEQSLRLLFEDWMPAGRAADSASDWGGDRLAIFESSEQRIVRWHLVFDTEKAAERALVALGRGALRLELARGPHSQADTRPFIAFEQAQRAVQKGRLCRERPQRGPFAIVRRNSQIGVTLGPFRRDHKPTGAENQCSEALRWADQLSSSG